MLCWMWILLKQEAQSGFSLWGTHWEKILRLEFLHKKMRSSDVVLDVNRLNSG